VQLAAGLSPRDPDGDDHRGPRHRWPAISAQDELAGLWHSAQYETTATDTRGNLEVFLAADNDAADAD
jgi:hypothetical protein